jgi:hypothetical protein
MAHSLLVRGASFALSVFLLLPAFAAAAGSAPLGTLRSDGAVYVESTKVPTESALFSGDRVSTVDGRALLSLPHGSSFMIDRATSAVLHGDSQGFTIGLEKGRLTLNSNPLAPLQVETAGLTMTSAGRFPSLAEVAMLADGSVSLSVHRGAIVVRNASEQPIVIKAGNFITVGPQTLQKDQTPGTAAHGSKTASQAAKGIRLGSLSHGASVAVVGGLVAVTAAAIAIPLAVNNNSTPASPSVP